MKTSRHCQTNGQARPVCGYAGFTLVEILIVVATIGLLSAIAVPNYVKARSSARVKACVSNLKQIHGIKSQWAIENKKAGTATPSSCDLVVYFNSGAMPTCPATGCSYTIRSVSVYPTCNLYNIGHTLDNLNMDDDACAD